MLHFHIYVSPNIVVIVISVCYLITESLSLYSGVFSSAVDVWFNVCVKIFYILKNINHVPNWTQVRNYYMFWCKSTNIPHFCGFLRSMMIHDSRKKKFHIFIHTAQWCELLRQINVMKNNQCYIKRSFNFKNKINIIIIPENHIILPLNTRT